MVYQNKVTNLEPGRSPYMLLNQDVSNGHAAHCIPDVSHHVFLGAKVGIRRACGMGHLCALWSDFNAPPHWGGLLCQVRWVLLH